MDKKEYLRRLKQENSMLVRFYIWLSKSKTQKVSLADEKIKFEGIENGRRNI